MTATPLVLHVWPGRWALPSIDAGCLEAILFLQLAFPGLYSLVETADTDQSPSGQLPFLTHGQIVVSPLPSIISYLSSLNYALLKPSDFQNEYEIDPSTVNPNLDAGLSALELSQRTAWRAYFEAQLGDLVAHSFFVLEPNFSGFTHGMLTSMLPVPQRYYVPRRIRDSYRPRLEAVGLWLIANEPEGRQESRGAERRKADTREDKIKRAFGQAKLVQKASVVFDITTKLLNDKSFIFTDRPTTADLALASRILLLVHAPLPNPALKELLNASYSSLVSYATRIHALAFPASPSASNPPPPILTPPCKNPFEVFKTSLNHLLKRSTYGAEESEEAKRFRRYRWGWFALAFASAVGYVMIYDVKFPLVITYGRDPAGFQQGPGEDDEELLDDMDMDDIDL